MAVYIITLVFLVYESVVDIRKKKIDVRAAAVAGVFDMIFGLAVYGHRISNIIFGAGVGILLIVCAWISRQRIGYGDGIVFIVLGMCMEPEKVLGILWGSMLLAGIYGTIKIMALKKSRSYALPFIPFVTAVYVVVFIAKLCQGEGGFLA